MVTLEPRHARSNTILKPAPTLRVANGPALTALRQATDRAPATHNTTHKAVHISLDVSGWVLTAPRIQGTPPEYAHSNTTRNLVPT